MGELKNLRSKPSKNKEKMLSLTTRYGSYDRRTCEKSNIKTVIGAIGCSESSSNKIKKNNPYEVKQLTQEFHVGSHVFLQNHKLKPRTKNPSWSIPFMTSYVNSNKETELEDHEKKRFMECG